MEYRILEVTEVVGHRDFNTIHEVVKKLEKTINRYVRHGWVPQGGISITGFAPEEGNYANFVAAQAMIRTK